MKHLNMMQKRLPLKDFERNLFEYQEPWRVDVNGARHYTLGDDVVPSVTTILGSLSEGKFDWWYEAIGHENANRIVHQSVHRGEQLHKMAENYMLGRDILTVDEEVPSFDVEAFGMFSKMVPVLNEHVDHIMLVEGKMKGNKVHAAGTVDLFQEWDGEPAVIDFKNARKEKKKEYVYDYFIQETIYSLIIYEMFGIQPKKIVTLIATEGMPDITVFVEDPMDYAREAMQIIKQYEEKVNE